MRIRNIVPSLRVVRRHRSTLAKERAIVEVNCHEYPTDEWTNVNPRILSHLNRNLYLQVHTRFFSVELINNTDTFLLFARVSIRCHWSGDPS